MNRTSLLFIILTTCVFVTNAQNYIYRGSKMYKATNTWKFEAMDWNLPEISIGKDSTKGILMFSVQTPLKDYHISGDFILFLEDGTMIKCIDRNIRDYVDGKSIALYFLTASEIEKLKLSRITEIRYSIKEHNGINAYTAENKKFIYIVPGKKSSEKEYYETDKEIKELFDNN